MAAVPQQNEQQVEVKRRQLSLCPVLQVSGLCDVHIAE